jgi:hypothetical protein
VKAVRSKDSDKTSPVAEQKAPASSSPAVKKSEPHAKSPKETKESKASASPKQNKKEGKVPEGKEKTLNKNKVAANKGSSVPKVAPASKVLAPPAAPAVKVESKFSTVSEWAKAHKPLVADSDVFLKAWAEKEGLPFFPKKDVSINGHSVSAFARTSAALHVLAMEGKGKTEMKILSYFGSDREKNLNPKDSPPFANNLKVVWSCAPDTPIAGDAARGMTLREPLAIQEQSYDCAMIVDVYQTGNTAFDALQPRHIKQLCRLTTTGKVYGLFRRFTGMMGADVFIATVNDKLTKKVEGVWVRNKQDQIVFKPEASATAYAPHPDLPWLQKRSTVEGLDISELKFLGPYVLYRFAETYADAVELQPSEDDPGIVVRKLLSPPATLYNRCEAFVVGAWNGLCEKLPQAVAEIFTVVDTTEPVLVHLGAVAELQGNYSTRIVSGIVADSARAAVATYFEKDTLVSAVKAQFPTFYRAVYEGTVSAVLFGTRDHDSERMFTNRMAFSNTERRLIAARGQATPPELGWTWVGKAFVCIIAIKTIKDLIDMMSATRTYFTAGNVVFRLIDIVRYVRCQLHYFMMKTWKVPNSFVLWFQIAYLQAIKLQRLLLLIAQNVFDGKEICYGVFRQGVSMVTAILPKIQTTVFDFWKRFRGPHTAGAMPDFMSRAMRRFLSDCEDIMGGNFSLVVSAATEELLSVHPLVQASIMGIEFASYGYQQYQLHGNAAKAVWQVLPAAVMHFCHARLIEKVGYLPSLPQRLVGHGLFNYAARWRPELACAIGFATKFRLNSQFQVREAFKTFKEAHDRAEVINDCLAGYREYIPPGSILKAITCSNKELPSNFRGRSEAEWMGKKMSPKEVLELVSNLDEPVKEQMWVIAGTNAMMYQPANTVANLINALYLRIHNNPFGSRAPEELRFKMWRDLFDEMAEGAAYDWKISEILDIEECASLMPGTKGARIMRAHDMALKGLSVKLYKEVKVKWDETLPLKILSEGATVKPRAITNLDPVYHAACLPYARAIAEYLHTMFDGDFVFHVGDDRIPVRFHFCSGYTPINLQRILYDIDSGDVVVCVAGDDSFVSWGRYWSTLGGGYHFAECDQSAFDHSQDKGPMEFNMNQWMRKIGVPSHIIHLFNLQTSSPYKIKTRNGQLVIKGEAGVQMPTGASITTTVNSHNTLCMYWFAIWKRIHLNDAAFYLGFTIKYHPKSLLTECTFLKGWWLPSLTCHKWLPLPSAVVKLGKVLRDPSSITGQKDPQKAIQVVAYAIARSYGQVDESYPILGPFLMMLLRLSKTTEDERLQLEKKMQMNPIENWEFKVHPIVRQMDRPGCIQAICHRYHCEQEDIERVEQLFKHTEKLPVYFEDPLFVRLRDVDYA